MDGMVSGLRARPEACVEGIRRSPEPPQVWVKLVEVRDDGGGNLKLGCSMKAVNQQTGADLDPQNAMLR